MGRYFLCCRRLKLISVLQIADLKMNGGTRGLAFLNNSNHVSTTSDQGLVYQWDLRTYRCFNVFEDEGKSKSTSIAVDSNDQYHVIGYRDKALIRFILTPFHVF